MKGEIEKYKNEKKTQINSIKQKAEEIHAKNKTIQGYEYKCSKNETRIKKQETQIRSKTENKTAYLNQAKNEIKSLQKGLSELIQKHQQIKIFRISRQLFMKRSKHQTVRRHSQTERKYHRHGKSKQIVKITKQMKQKLIIPLNKNIII